MPRFSKILLKTTFAVDALIAVGFGAYSWWRPFETFGTILAIPPAHASVFAGILACLSLFYIVIGLTCLIGFRSAAPAALWIGGLMLFRHLAEGILKVNDLGKEWLIGNPYPDLVVHAVFIGLYGVAIIGLRGARESGAGIRN